MYFRKSFRSARRCLRKNDVQMAAPLSFPGVYLKPTRLWGKTDLLGDWWFKFRRIIHLDFVLSISVICFSAVLCNQRPKDASARLSKQHIEARAARMARLSVTSSAEIMEWSCSCEHVSRSSDGAMENAISFSDLALNTAATVNSISFTCLALLWVVIGCTCQ